jgi:hypothetical protein
MLIPSPNLRTISLNETPIQWIYVIFNVAYGVLHVLILIWKRSVAEVVRLFCILD